MRKLTEYPTLSLKERDRRWALTRAEMAKRGLDCLVLFGWPAMWDFNIANARYLCPIGGNAENNVLVFPLSGEPTSFIYSPVFTDYWKGAQSWVADVRPRKGSFGDSVAERLSDLKLTNAKIGVDGLAGPLDPDGWTPHSIYTRIKDRLPGASLINLEDMMEKLRVVKSAEEIAALDKAARLGDLMLAACRDTARPGVKECEVYANMVQTMLANGGEEPTLFLWASDKHPYPHPFRVPTTRPLEKGDMIICEMHPKFGGYFTHVERTFCLGQPEPRYLDIYAACLAAYRKGLDLFKPGAKISTAMDAVRDVITGSGFGICEAGIHGHGLASLEYPRYRHHALRADEGALKAIGDEFRSRHGVRHEHRPVRSEVAQRRNRLCVRRDHRHHRHRRATDALVLHRLPAVAGLAAHTKIAFRSLNEDVMVKLPEGAPKLEEILVDTAKVPWREKSLKGIFEKMLWRDEATGASIAMIKFAKGAGIPQPHYHSSNQFMICLSGRYEYTATGVTLTPGSFYCNPKGNVHGPAVAHEDTVMIEIYDGPHYPEKPSWYTDERDAH